MKKVLSLVILIFLIIYGGGEVLGDTRGDSSEKFYEELALYWAPLLYHDVGVSYGEQGLEDIPMRIDFDNDWIGNNNWENLEIENWSKEGFDYRAYIYYSVLESEKNYYLIYTLFHPKDEANQVGSIDKHENDLESILINIQKNELNMGKFMGMITQSHGWFNYYRPKDLTFEEGRPKVWIDSGGHAIYNYRGESAKGILKDGVVYYPVKTFGKSGRNSFFHTVINKGKQREIGNFVKRFEYELLKSNDVFLRNLEDYKVGNKDLFARFGVLSGDTHKDNAAAFLWSVGSLNKYYSAFGWQDPVVMFNMGFGKDFRGLNHKYIKNDNYTYNLQIEKIRTNEEGINDIYIDVFINGGKMVSNYVWKKKDVKKDQWVKIKLFGDENKSGFTTETNELLLAIPYSQTNRKNMVEIHIKKKSAFGFSEIDVLKFSDIEKISSELKNYRGENKRGEVILKVSRKNYY